MQRGALFVVEIVAGVFHHQVEHGPFREVGRLVDDESAVLDGGLECHGSKASTCTGRLYAAFWVFLVARLAAFLGGAAFGESVRPRISAAFIMPWLHASSLSALQARQGLAVLHMGVDRRVGAKPACFANA